MEVPTTPRVFIPRSEIAAAVQRLADRITPYYHDKNPLLIGVLKGCFLFMADFVRYLGFPVEVEFITLSSYGSGQDSSGTVEIVQGLRCELKGRHVLVVEDIIDTGLTVSFLMEFLKTQGPASLKLCTLLDKPERRKCEVHIDYLGLTVPDRFLVGYGLDCNEQYRNLPDICVLGE